jgi:hypothetical protein
MSSEQSKQPQQPQQPDPNNPEYRHAIERGRRLCGLLETFNSVVQGTPSDLRTVYKVENRRQRGSVVGQLRRALSGWGLEDLDAIRYVEVKSREPEDAEAAYINNFAPKSGIIMIDEHDKFRDETDPNQKLQASEVTWQSWVVAADSARCDSGSVKAVAVFKAKNDTTKPVLWHAARLSTNSGQDENHQVEYTDNDDGFYAALGSVNGGTVVRMLADHKADIGYRKVDRVILLGDPELKLEAPVSRNFVLLLSEPRSQQTSKSTTHGS